MLISIEDVVPFIVMMLVECVEVSSLTLAKSAMNNGMSQLVYVVYYNVLGTIVLFPFFAVHNCRSNWPPITSGLIFRFMILGLLGIGFLQPLGYAGINYSSPTLSTALGNLIPAYTYLIAIIFRMEKLDIRSSSSQAKSIGTFIAISGALLLTLYKGPEIIRIVSYDSTKTIVSSQASNWILGGLLLAITGILLSTWHVLQTATIKEHPDEITMVFYVSCFGTIICAIFSLIIERNFDAWLLNSSYEIVAVVFAGVFLGAFRNRVLVWCLHKKGPVYVAMFKPLSMVIAVIMGIMFLGDTLYSGSVIGAMIIAAGFYAVVWGQANEKTNLSMGEEEFSIHKTPLLLCENEVLDL
ncbi:WAT1-related protein At5g40240-like [Rutidosis leptorrhynchoides]|uniref:WAT1-related protein At5g40240-like n=1 Tax=Rutidosis leptorrhynchoides TaxID=125765 RepID=UPI003A9A0EE8